METSSIGRVVSVLFAPRRTFESIAQRPTWIWPAIVLLVVSTIVGQLAWKKIDPSTMFKEQVASGQMSQEQADRGTEMMERNGSKFALLGIAVAPVAWLLIAAVFLVVLRLAGGEIGFKQSFATLLHSFMPQVISALLAIPVLLARTETLSMEEMQGGLLASNAAAFAPEESSRALVSLLSSLDVFVIWTLVLMAIGYAATARVSRRTAAVVTFVLWAVYVGGKVGWAWMQS